ncbi:hypothetical protein FKM82_021518, partial [Ascaphus truei]
SLSLSNAPSNLPTYVSTLWTNRGGGADKPAAEKARAAGRARLFRLSGGSRSGCRSSGRGNSSGGLTSRRAPSPWESSRRTRLPRALEGVGGPRDPPKGGKKLKAGKWW